ncbi:c-type cytochrome [Bordetella pseudohinzii]|uniref:Cytochrome C n=1 Tax=Bordetella pseudohinzii TaxID=1331258 RepID=A0A0J6C9F2_9BORD|nr:c-type cytochrome [Bordetella pseudohinzii]ANY14995.1 cytochrome C [Bordetella pseudohinzii]KMM26027.1 cytochrome C [Bordetella pseudohinzii]KXA75523.1 cytochrome C [Bordetella pseudohinzii]KXA78853.1 cytochrome C [Bordetella pseudohinzii]CUI96117.1 Cytochrome c552 [Bordetella pseudohinzii]
MYLNLKLALGSAALLLAAPVQAQTTGLDLAKSKACMACHQVDSKRVGPPLSSVAERYAGQPEAADYLANKIRNGGRGAWGAVPMPAQSQVSPDEARELAQWVLTLAPAKKP